MNPNIDIVTNRLHLVPISPETLEALISQDVDRATSLHQLTITEEFVSSLESAFLSTQLDGVRDRPFDSGWFVRAIVRIDDDVVIGHCGFHGPPEVVGRAEIGYNILPSYRANSYATEAVNGLVAWANQQGFPVVVAAIAPTNRASMRVAEKAGFYQTGERTDTYNGVESQMLVFESRI